MNNIYQRQIFSGLSEIHNSDIDDIKYNKDTNENSYLINLKSGKLMDDW
jgi:hypothetical protein